MNQNTFDYIPEEPETKGEKEHYETPQEVVEVIEVTSEMIDESSQEEETTSTDLVVICEKTPLEVFSEENGLDPIIEQIKREVEKEVFDPSTEEGRTRIGSVARKIGSAKGKLETMSKGLTEDWRKKTKAVTSETTRMKKKMDELRDQVLAPRDEYNRKKQERENKFNCRIQDMRYLCNFEETPTVLDIEAAISNAKKLYDFEWEEFKNNADDAFNNSVMPYLTKLLEERKKAEEEAAELERLRKEEQERKEKEEQEALAKATISKILEYSTFSGDPTSEQVSARKDALLLFFESELDGSQEEIKKAFDESQEKLSELYKQSKEAEEKAEKERQEKIKQEAEKARIEEHKDSIEKIEKCGTGLDDLTAAQIQGKQIVLNSLYERDWEEFADQAKDKYVPVKKTLADMFESKQKEEQDSIRKEAEEAERKRQEEADRQEEEDRKKREENKKHRAKINNEALEDLVEVLAVKENEGKDLAKVVVEAIAKGKVRNVKIEY